MSVYSLDNHFHKPQPGIKSGIQSNESGPHIEGDTLHHPRSPQHTRPDDRPIKGANPPVQKFNRRIG